jgi:hypothetical protein
MAIMAVRPGALGRSDCDRIAFRLIVGKVIPGVTTFTVALAYRPPNGAQARSPLLPGNSLVPSRLKSGRFSSQGIACCHRPRAGVRFLPGALLRISDPSVASSASIVCTGIGAFLPLFALRLH